MKSSFPFSILIAFTVIAGSCDIPAKPKSDTSPTATAPDNIVENLQADIATNPDSIRLYDRLMDTLAGRNNFSSAANWCDTLIKNDPDKNFPYWYIRGDLYRSGKLYDSAISSYKAFLNRFPDDEEILLKLANTQAEAGYESCIPLCNDILRRFRRPDMQANTAFIKGVYYNTTGKYAEARKWLDLAIGINYNFTEAHLEKGYSFFDEGNAAEALKVFGTLNKLNPKNADAFYWMAKCEAALEKNELAIGHYEQALQLDPNITEAKTALQQLKTKN